VPTTRELCEARQIPVTSSHPRWMYIASVCSDEEDIEEKHPWSLWDSVPLTAHDADMIRSYIEYVCTGFYGRDSFEDFVDRWTPDKAKPYAVIGGHNTIVFLKRGDNDWAYRQSTWNRGPTFMPQPATGDGEPLDLPALLDRIVTHNGLLDKKDWTAWKAARPEAFAPEVAR